jgi:hypothetical protein
MERKASTKRDLIDLLEEWMGSEGKREIAIKMAEELIEKGRVKYEGGEYMFTESLSDDEFFALWEEIDKRVYCPYHGSKWREESHQKCRVQMLLESYWKLREIYKAMVSEKDMIRLEDIALDHLTQGLPSADLPPWDKAERIREALKILDESFSPTIFPSEKLEEMRVLKSRIDDLREAIWDYEKKEDIIIFDEKEFDEVLEEEEELTEERKIRYLLKRNPKYRKYHLSDEDLKKIRDKEKLIKILEDERIVLFRFEIDPSSMGIGGFSREDSLGKYTIEPDTTKIRFFGEWWVDMGAQRSYLYSYNEN